MASAMAVDEESLPAGVYRRKKNGRLYFEMRHGERKLYSTKIATVEEGALCYDIVRRYSEGQCCVATPGGERGKRKAPRELNYPEFSPSLVLEDLPTDFDTHCKKEGATEVILKQARAAAKALPKHAQAKSRAKVQKHLAQDVGSQRIDYESSPHQNAHGIPPRGANDHQDLAGVDRNSDVAKFFQDVCEHCDQCRRAYALKVSEREALERTVSGIKEDMGVILLPNCGLDIFHQHMAQLKYLISGDGEFSRLLEVEQAYKSEESKCWKLQKIVEDHNLKSVSESLISDGNTMTGRRRVNETERLPSVLEICPTEDEINFSMPVQDVSACCDPPASPLVLDVKSFGEKSIAMPSVVEMDTTLPVASDEFASDDVFTDEDKRFLSSLLDTSTNTGNRRENEDERLAEVCANSNIEIPYFDDWTPDWSDNIAFFNLPLH